MCIYVSVLYQLQRLLTSIVAGELGREPTTTTRVSRIFAEKGDTAPLSDFIRSDGRSPRLKSCVPAGSTFSSRGP